MRVPVDVVAGQRIKCTRLELRRSTSESPFHRRSDDQVTGTARLLKPTASAALLDGSVTLRILLVAYRFPPQAGGGVQRPSKLVKYLVRSGQEVAVLTGPERWTDRDATLLADLPPGLLRVSVPDPSPFRGLQEFRRRLKHHTPARAVQGILWAMSATAVPDLSNGWAAAALGPAVDLVQRFRPDVIVVTGPPWSPLVLTKLLSMSTGVPFVIDYRDPWTENYLELERPRIQRAANPHLERWVLRSASGVIGAHRAILRRLEPILPAKTPRVWIPNGYDPEDLHGPHSEADPALRDRFVLAYTGSFFDRRYPGVLFGVIDELLTAGSLDPRRFCFRLAGEPGPVRRLLSSLPKFSEVFRHEGYLSHPESVDVLRHGDLNLVYESDGERNLTTPAKFYETLAAGRPVLLVCPRGVTERLGRKIGGCIIVDPDDVQGTRTALLRAYEAWLQGRALPGPALDRCRYYDRERLARRTLAFLRRVADRAPTR